MRWVFRPFVIGPRRINNDNAERAIRSVSIIFTNPYANEKGDGRRNSNPAISKEFYKGLFGDGWHRRPRVYRLQ
jgi:hypothetical protein